jgi:hypothetical protein
MVAKLAGTLFLTSYFAVFFLVLTNYGKPNGDQTNEHDQASSASLEKREAS